MGIPDYVETPLKQNGDFRSDECIEILKEADIVVTNPPFSLFREYMAVLMEYKKEFLIIGRGTAATYKEILPLFLNGQLWLGRNNGHFWFRVPDYYEAKSTDFKIDENGVKWRRMGNICWFTNLDYKERHEDLTIHKHYTPEPVNNIPIIAKAQNRFVFAMIIPFLSYLITGIPQHSSTESPAALRPCNHTHLEYS